MHVLLTGGAGFIGSHIADALLEAGHEVTILDDLSSGRRENVPDGARFVHGDIRDEDLLERVFSEAKPEAVCHQGAQTSVSVSTREPARDADVNILGSIRVLDAARRHEAARLVFASTGGAIYGEVPEGERARVGWPTRPISPYGCSKLAFEGYLGAYAAEHGFVSTVLRYGNVYGPRQDPHGEAGVVAIFSERLGRGEPIQVNAREEVGDEGCVRDYVHVRDVVRANLLALEGGLDWQTVNVASGRPTATREIATLLASALGSKSEIRAGARRAGDLARSVLEPSPELGFEASPLEDGLRETAEFFAAKGRG